MINNIYNTLKTDLGTLNTHFKEKFSTDEQFAIANIAMRLFGTLGMLKFSLNMTSALLNRSIVRLLTAGTLFVIFHDIFVIGKNLDQTLGGVPTTGIIVEEGTLMEPLWKKLFTIKLG